MSKKSDQDLVAKAESIIKKYSKETDKRTARVITDEYIRDTDKRATLCLQEIFEYFNEEFLLKYDADTVRLISDSTSAIDQCSAHAEIKSLERFLYYDCNYENNNCILHNRISHQFKNSFFTTSTDGFLYITRTIRRLTGDINTLNIYINTKQLKDVFNNNMLYNIEEWDCYYKDQIYEIQLQIETYDQLVEYEQL